MSDDSYLKKLSDKETVDTFKSLYTYKGVVLPTLYQKFADEIENFEVRNDDVWVTSFPKSGTTWVQEMVWLIGNDLNYEQAKVNIVQRFPFLEQCTIKDALQTDQSPECMRRSVDFAKNTKGKRYIKSHLSWDLLPAQIRDNVKQPKIIHVVRNPKDACVSFFHFSKFVHGYTETLESYVKLFLDGKLLFGPYWTVIMSYWSRRSQKNVLILKFENLKKDLPSVIRQVASFLGKQLTEVQVEKLAHHLSFEQMKCNRAVNYENLVVEFKANNPEVTGTFMRKGEVGDFKNTLTDEMIKWFDKLIEEKFAGSGLTFEC